MDQGQLTGAVFTGLRKAFDTVDHAVLLDKLSNLGIADIGNGWFTDFLSNRTQVVEFQGVTSNPEVLVNLAASTSSWPNYLPLGLRGWLLFRSI